MALTARRRLVAESCTSDLDVDLQVEGEDLVQLGAKLCNGATQGLAQCRGLLARQHRKSRASVDCFGSASLSVANMAAPDAKG